MEGDVKIFVVRINRKSISIHTLRMEGDAVLLLYNCKFQYFNPHPPHGG